MDNVQVTFCSTLLPSRIRYCQYGKHPQLREVYMRTDYDFLEIDDNIEEIMSELYTTYLFTDPELKKIREREE